MFTKNALLGEHNVCFYTSTKEKQNLLFSNLKAGLDQGCSGLYVAGEENIEQVQFEMRKFGLETDDPKKLRSIKSQQFYMPDGEFRVNRILEQVRSTLDESLDKGFEGLYVSADVSKFFEYITKKRMTEEWLEYEKDIGRKTSLPIERMCAYSINQVKTHDYLFFNLIQAHKNTVSVKKRDFLDNENLCRSTITEELKKILGVQATEYILAFLEKRLKTPRNQLLANIVDFNQGLEIVFGDGALSIEKHILKKLHKKIELSDMSVEVV
jgi:hypothetical protein